MDATNQRMYADAQKEVEKFIQGISRYVDTRVDYFLAMQKGDKDQVSKATKNCEEAENNYMKRADDLIKLHLQLSSHGSLFAADNLEKAIGKLVEDYSANPAKLAILETLHRYELNLADVATRNKRELGDNDPLIAAFVVPIQDALFTRDKLNELGQRAKAEAQRLMGDLYSEFPMWELPEKTP
jgi:hypothetical protein